jgi:putative transposase
MSAMQIARQPQVGLVHHVISRFVDKRWLIVDDADRSKYLDYLGRALSASDWRCLAFAIMSSHLHLAMIAGATAPERWMRRVNPPFASWLNRRHELLGPAFAKRPDMWIVPDANVGRLLSYIHNNPVRAGVVKAARDSSWTSHQAYIGLARSPAWLHVDAGLSYAGSPAALFDEYVEAGGDVALTTPLQGVHREARKRGAIELGTPIVGEVTKVPLVIRAGTHVRPTLPAVIDAMCAALGTDIVALRSRKLESIDARASVVRCATEMGFSRSHVAATLGFSASSGSRLALRSLGGLERAAIELVQQRFAR